MLVTDATEQRSSADDITASVLLVKWSKSENELKKNHSSVGMEGMS